MAVHFTCEVAGYARDDYPAVQRAIRDSLQAAARNAGLEAWAAKCPKPLVLFFDEIDSLSGPSLESVLRQLRAGYNARPAPFPSSVVLCGMRDVRDYEVASGVTRVEGTGQTPTGRPVALLRA